MKVGLSYYTLQTDRYQDPKIKRLKRKFKASGLGVYDYVLSEIYRIKGCYITWNSETCFDVAEYFEMDESEVNEIVNHCVSVGLFDAKAFIDFSILTSKSIQNRFLEMSRKAKRVVEIPENIKICTEDSSIIREELAKLPEKTIEIPQVRIGKDRIGKDKLRTNVLLFPVGTSDDRSESKKEYEKVQSELTGKDPIEQWKMIKDFITTNKPDSIIPYMDAWNIFAIGNNLSILQAPSGSRIKKLKTRLKDSGFDFYAIMAGIKKSDFLKGLAPGRDWKVTFDWIIENDTNFLQIIEGKFK